MVQEPTTAAATSAQGVQPASQFPAGWYDYPQGGGRRFWDGQQWTDHFVPPPAEPERRAGGPGIAEIIVGVALGMILGWGLIYLGAQIAPDDIYWPVKFVVEEGGEVALGR